MKKTFVLFILLAWVAVYADMAPAPSSGVTLTITNNNVVRMKKEEVDIYYQGRYAQVKAVFVMENRTGKPVALNIGFPVVAYGNPENMISDFERMKNTLFDFKVRENGRPVNFIVAQKVIKKIPNQMDKNWLWFAWKQKFPPGETVVDVEYRIAPYLYYYSFFKSIYYILSTGAIWRNRIGEARISVHFPKLVTKEQVTTETTPTGFLIEGDTITWKFRDFEPSEKNNLQLEFIPFWIYDKMQALRAQIKQDPLAIKPKLELARLYFNTVWEPGVGHSLPRNMDEKRFNEEVLQKIAGSDDRVYFLSSYEKDGKTGLYRPNFEGTKENIPQLNRLEEILSVYGYEGNDPSTVRFKPFMKEAETLLQEAIAIDPHSTEAWNTTIFYYYQLYYAGFKPDRTGPYNSFIPEGQKDLIRRGFAACPNDPGIRLWMELIDDSLKPVPEDIGTIDYFYGSPEWSTPKIFGHGRGGLVDKSWVEQIERYFRKDILCFYSNSKSSPYPNTRRVAHRFTKNSFFNGLLKIVLQPFYKDAKYRLLRKDMDYSPEQKADIVRLLKQHDFYSLQYAKKIWGLAEKTGLVIERNKLYEEIFNSN